jgi:hypothetical protein
MDERYQPIAPLVKSFIRGNKLINLRIHLLNWRHKPIHGVVERFMALH